MNDQERIEWIDGASYEELLRRWRHGPIGDPMFQGEVGSHYKEVMHRRQDEETDGGVGTSKRVG